VYKDLDDSIKYKKLDYEKGRIDFTDGPLMLTRKARWIVARIAILFDGLDCDRQSNELDKAVSLLPGFNRSSERRQEAKSARALLEASRAPF
jgi:hypothetical protein